MSTKSKAFEVEANIRNEQGASASRRLRREEKVPGIVYGGGQNPVALTMDHNKMSKALQNETFYSKILTLKIDDKSERVILKDVQRHPYKARLLHVDFLRVRADEKLTMNVPIHFVGGEKSPGVKAGGLISHIMSDVEITCLPDDLPEYLELDLSMMEVNDTKHFSDLKLPKGVEIVNFSPENDQAIASIHMPRAEEEIPTEAPVATEVPAIAQKSEAELAAEAASKSKEKEGKK